MQDNVNAVVKLGTCTSERCAEYQEKTNTLSFSSNI